jgi:hypothetical protein
MAKIPRWLPGGTDNLRRENYEAYLDSKYNPRNVHRLQRRSAATSLVINFLASMLLTIGYVFDGDSRFMESVPWPIIALFWCVTTLLFADTMHLGELAAVFDKLPVAASTKRRVGAPMGPRKLRDKSLIIDAYCHLATSDLQPTQEELAAKLLVDADTLRTALEWHKMTWPLDFATYCEADRST